MSAGARGAISRSAACASSASDRAQAFQCRLHAQAIQRARIESATFIAPPDFSFHPGQIAAGAGSKMVISFRPVPSSPVRQLWDATITEFAWGGHFCDEQRGRGPFAYMSCPSAR